MMINASIHSSNYIHLSIGMQEKANGIFALSLSVGSRNSPGKNKKRPARIARAAGYAHARSYQREVKRAGCDIISLSATRLNRVVLSKSRGLAPAGLVR